MHIVLKAYYEVSSPSIIIKLVLCILLFVIIIFLTIQLNYSQSYSGIGTLINGWIPRVNLFCLLIEICSTFSIISPKWIMNWPLYIEGTGKTITGAHLVYFFNRQNQLLPPSGDENQRPQILYCGPSNKSVDVITGKRSSKLSPDSVRVHVYKHLSLLIHLAPVATFHPLLSPAFVIDYS